MTVKDTIADEFNEFSKNYTEDMVKCVPYYLDLLNSFTEELPKNFQPKTILDLGCGNGNVTNILTKMFPDAQYTMVDASQDMLDFCDKRFSNYTINLVNSYFNDFGFSNNYYDLIVAGFSLHHCIKEDKKIIYKKIHASLSQNGIFACSDLMIDKTSEEHITHLETWKAFVSQNFDDTEKWTWLMEHYKQFDRPESTTNHKKWLEQVGFKQIEFRINENYWAHFKAQKNT